jgi:hypothetical protein
MDKANALFLYYTSPDDIGRNRAFDEPFFRSHLQSQDNRVARLLVLLQQLNESAEGLETLPEPELTEIVHSAIRLCGFVNPIETQNAIAAVLDAIEMQDRFTKRTPAAGRGMGLCDA